MVNRQESIEDIVRIDVHVALCPVAVGNVVLMAEHDTLGSSRGAAGEHDCGHFLAGGILYRVFLGALHLVDAVLAVAFKGDLGDVQGNLVDLLVVCEQNLGLGKAHEVRDDLARKRIVYGNDHRTGIGDCEIGDCPLWAVLSGKTYPVAVSDAQLIELGGNTLDDCPGLGIGVDHMGGCESLEGLVVRISGCRYVEQLFERRPFCVEKLPFSSELIEEVPGNRIVFGFL